MPCRIRSNTCVRWTYANAAVAYEIQGLLTLPPVNCFGQSAIVDIHLLSLEFQKKLSHYIVEPAADQRKLINGYATNTIHRLLEKQHRNINLFN